MKHEDLFNEYKQKLNWIDRRLQPDILKAFNDKAEYWKHAKEVAFGMYQHLRYFCDDGIPTNCIDYKTDVSNIPDYILDETSFKCIGILSYRDLQFPVYNDNHAKRPKRLQIAVNVAVNWWGRGILDEHTR